MEEPHNSLTPKPPMATENTTSTDFLASTCGENRESVIKNEDSASSEITSSAFEMNASTGVLENQIKSEVDDSTLSLSTQPGLNANPTIDMDKVHQQHFNGPTNVAGNMIMDESGDKTQSNMISNWINQLPQHLRSIAAQNPTAFLQQISAVANNNNNNFSQVPAREIMDSISPAAGHDETQSSGGHGATPSGMNNQLSMQFRQQQQLQAALLQQKMSQSNNQFHQQQQQQQLMMNFASGIPNPSADLRNANMPQSTGMGNIPVSVPQQQQQQQNVMNNFRMAMNTTNSLSASQFLPNDLTNSVANPSSASTDSLDVSNLSENFSSVGDSNDQIEKQTSIMKGELNQIIQQINQLKASTNPQDREIMNAYLNRYNYLCRTLTQLHESTNPQSPSVNPTFGAMTNSNNNAFSQSQVNNQLLAQQMLINQMQQSQFQNNRIPTGNTPPINSPQQQQQQQQVANLQRQMMANSTNLRMGNQFPGMGGVPVQPGMPAHNRMFGSFQNNVVNGPATSVGTVPLPGGGQLTLPLTTIQQLHMMPPAQQQQCLIRLAAANIQSQGMMQNFQNQMASSMRFPPGSNVPGMQNAVAAAYRQNLAMGNANYGPMNMNAVSRMTGQFPMNTHPNMAAAMHQMNPRMAQYNTAHFQPGITKDMMIQAAMQGKIPLSHGASMRGPAGLGLSSRRGQKQTNNRRRRRQDSESEEDDDDDDDDMSSSSQELTPTSEMLAAAVVAEGGLRRSSRTRKQRTNYQAESDLLFSDDEDGYDKQTGTHSAGRTNRRSKDNDGGMDDDKKSDSATGNFNSSDLVAFQPIESTDGRVAIIETIFADRIRNINSSSDESDEDDDDVKPDENRFQTFDTKDFGEELAKKSARVDNTKQKKIDTSHGTTPEKEYVEEFYVKYKYFSHLHCEWASLDQLKLKDPKAAAKVKKYKIKKNELNSNAFLTDEYFNPDYLEIDRILAVTTTVDKSANTAENEEEENSQDNEAVKPETKSEDSQSSTGGNILTHYLVKWCSLPYEESTWELEEVVDDEKITEFKRNQQMPPLEICNMKCRPRPHEWSLLTESPKYKNGNTLRDYQLDGLNWLRDCYYNMRNCILADEMGLGKTIQSITFLNDVFQYGIRGPFLIIAPLSTIANWYREFQKWTDMNAILFHGSAMSRELIVRYEMFYPGTTDHININELLSSGCDKSNRNLLPPVGLKLPQPRIYKFHALITTYEIMLSENRFLSTIPWRVAIVDEAHRLKNRNAKSLEGLFQMTMEHRVLLTGTPLQNSVQELFSLLSFLDPNRMPDTDILMNELSQVDSNQQVARLQQILKPIMLRRLKEDVEKNIAPKEETIIEVEMTAVQRKVYRGILERDLSFLMKGSVGANVPNLMNTMMELRKCCNHPFLINGCEDKILAEFPVVTQEDFLETFWTSQSIVPITAVTSQQQPQPQQGIDTDLSAKEANESSVVRSSSMSHYPAKVEDIEKIQDSAGRQLTPTHLQALIQSSGKLVLVDKLLPKLLRNGHKVLIFSQMVRVLNLLEDYLVARRFNYERIDGSVRGNLRQAAIDRFSKPGSDRFVFLLCTKAGGLGINLTAADTVIIFDSDWNPQNDLQAQARCHRIGQNKAVKVYRLICRNTYEREMFDRASLKLGLDKAVLQNINNSMSSENSQLGATSNRAQLSKKDVEDLLKRGAYGALMDEDVDSSAQFCAEDIDQILERRSTIVRIVGEGQGSTFAKASFTAESGNSAELNLDDPDFWKKWARKANVSADDDEKHMDAEALLFNDTPRIRRTTSGYAREDIDNLSDEDDDSGAGFYRGYRGGSYVRRSRRGNAPYSGADDAYSAEDDDDEDFSDSDLSDSNSRFHITTVSRTTKRTSWIRAECHKVERNLLIYGWGRWRDIYRACRFKTMVCLRDVIIISKAILVYCWHTSTKLDPSQKVFVEKIMEVAENYSYLYKNDISVSEEPLAYANSCSTNPGSTRKRRSKVSYGGNSGKRSRKVKNSKGGRKRGPTASNKRNAPTSAPSSEESCVVAFSAENWKEIDCNEFVTEASFRKRLKTNANKIIMRLRLLYLLENEIFKGQSKAIMKNVAYTDITLTKPNTIPSWFNENLTSWWNEDCDKSLLMGVLKHGYQNYAEIRNDQSLVFAALLSESSNENITQKESSKPSGQASISEDAPIVRPTRGRKKKSVSISSSNESPQDNCDSSTGVSKSKSAVVLANWPNSSDLNTRVRRLVNYFYKLSVKKAAKATKPAGGLKQRNKQSNTSNAHSANISNKMPESLKELLDSYVECVRMFGFIGGDDGEFSWTQFISVARSNCPEFDIGFQKLQEILQSQDNSSQSSDEKIQKFLDNAARSLIFSAFSLSASTSGDKSNYFSSLTPEIKDSIRERVEMFYYLRNDLMPILNEEVPIESAGETHLKFEETLKKYPEFCFDSSTVPTPSWWLEAIQQFPQVIRNFQIDLLRSVASYGFYPSVQSVLLSDSSYCFKSVFQLRHSLVGHDESGASTFDPKSIPVQWFSPQAVTKTIHDLYQNLHPDMSILNKYSVDENSHVHPANVLCSRTSASKRPFPSSSADLDQESSPNDVISSKRRLLDSSLPQTNNNNSNPELENADFERIDIKFDEKAEGIEKMSCVMDQSIGSSTLNDDEVPDESLLNDPDDPEIYDEDEDLIEDEEEEELEDEFHEDEDEDKNDSPDDEEEEDD